VDRGTFSVRIRQIVDECELNQKGWVRLGTPEKTYTAEESSFLCKLSRLRDKVHSQRNRLPTQIETFHLAVEVHEEFAAQESASSRVDAADIRRG